MSKKSSNQGLRLLMGAGSIIGFIGGWAILGQTGSTYTVQSTDNAIVSTVPAASQPLLTGTTTVTNPTAVATAVPTRTVVQITTQTTTSNSTRTTRLKTGGS